jgi:sugar (pentulose or hexulose) kinase
VEQDAEQWWAQILQLSKEAIDESGTARNIVAIGTCAQYFSSVPVDENGNAVHNAIMWEDTRASQYIKKGNGWLSVYAGI